MTRAALEFPSTWPLLFVKGDSCDSEPRARRGGRLCRGLDVTKSRGLKVTNSRGLEVTKSRGLDVTECRGLEVKKSRGLEVTKSRGLEMCRGLEVVAFAAWSGGFCHSKSRLF